MIGDISMSSITGLLVDLYGTIIPRPDIVRHDQLIDSIANILGIDRSLVSDRWRSTYYRRVTGVDGNTRGFSDHFTRSLVDDPSTDMIEGVEREWMRITSDLMTFFDDVQPSIRRLKERGIKIGLMTNCSANLPDLFEGSDIARTFDSFTYSSREGLTKPDTRLFLKGCQMLNVTPGSCAFVGDGDNDELIGSSNAGLMTIKIERGSIAGDYLIKPSSDWDPTIESFYELEGLLL